jgi:hypothetical protein
LIGTCCADAAPKVRVTASAALTIKILLFIFPASYHLSLLLQTNYDPGDLCATGNPSETAS